jgi:hypothetical protein
MPNARKRESARVANAQSIATMRGRKAPERPGAMRQVTATESKNPRNNGTTYNSTSRPRRGARSRSR